jgi:hypothetical protein
MHTSHEDVCEPGCIQLCALAVPSLAVMTRPHISLLFLSVCGYACGLIGLCIWVSRTVKGLCKKGFLVLERDQSPGNNPIAIPEQ